MAHSGLERLVQKLMHSLQVTFTLQLDVNTPEHYGHCHTLLHTPMLVNAEVGPAATATLQLVMAAANQ